MWGLIVVQIFRERLQPGYAGYTDGVDIYLDDRLDAVQTACTLVHELVHLEWGHKGHQPEAIEMAVRYETARRLLPDYRAGECRGSTLAEVAANLFVTRQVLMDRAASASDALASIGGCFECQLCPSIKIRAQHLASRN